MNEKLKDKRVLITAGAQGIGEAISRSFLSAGAKVAIHYFSSSENAEKIAGEASAIDQVCVTVGGDLTNENKASEIVEEAVAKLGGLDILINNAGSLVDRKELEEIDEAFWRKVIDINMSSMLYVSKAAKSHLVKNEASSIVNLASLAGRKGGHGGSLVYATSKGAILTFTRALAAELGPEGTRVNAVAPGLILGTSFHNTHTTDESANETIDTIPIGRAGNPNDVARAVAYLASEYDGFITGATIDINGGVYMA
ncbi:SDR family oxidoreductase [bacterium]|nr:SDR family oxidoreductase [bacterium]